jgi:hypothetical protein
MPIATDREVAVGGFDWLRSCSLTYVAEGSPAATALAIPAASTAPAVKR